jgi:nucleoside-diphosphate-sugar epimerase
VVCEYLSAAGHTVTGCDLARPKYEGGSQVESYLRADVTDFGDVMVAMRGNDAVVHLAGIPDIRFDPPHRVFAVNAVGAFNVAEAARLAGLTRVVYTSSETVTGLRFSRTHGLPRYLPIDEDHPTNPEDAYALSKLAGELAVRAACSGSALTGVILRPCWIQYPDTYAADIEPCTHDPERLAAALWGYVDGRDVASAVTAAITAEVKESITCYLSAEDNAAGRPLAELVGQYYPGDIPVRPGAQSAFSIARAEKALGWSPKFSWKDHQDAR